MDRISIEDAKEFIACKDDFTSEGIENAKYFTLTPSNKKGWEDVTYYTARKTTLYSNRDGDYDSWVYVLSNALQPTTYLTTLCPPRQSPKILFAGPNNLVLIGTC